MGTVSGDHVVPALHHDVDSSGHLEVDIRRDVSAMKKKNGGYFAERYRRMDDDSTRFIPSIFNRGS